ncbi:MAG: tetratricopeptide repeat protein, partial [Bryobacteraceae bacterium]
MTKSNIAIAVSIALGLNPAIFAGEAAQTEAGYTIPSEACAALNHIAMTEVANGQLEDAEAALSAALASDPQRPEHACAGLVLNNLAAVMSASGRMAEAETLAVQSLRILEESFPLDDPILLRPLHILAAARLEQGKTAAARQAFKRMQAIHVRRPEDRALVHGMAAVLLHAEGRHKEAEPEYLTALGAWQAAGHGETADAASVLNSLGALYIEEGRFEDARRALDRALAIFATAKDTVPMDRIKILNLCAALQTRQGEWWDAEEKLRQEVSIADRQEHLDLAEIIPVLANLA